MCVCETSLHHHAHFIKIPCRIIKQDVLKENDRFPDPQSMVDFMKGGLEVGMCCAGRRARVTGNAS